MSSDNPKKRLYRQFAAVARAFGHEHRLELLEQIAQGDRTVETLADRTGLSAANASQHLQHLSRAGLVVARRHGKHVVYRLSEGPVITTLASLREIAERNLAEVREVIRAYYAELDSMEPVARGELARRLKDGTVTLLDVRPADEYRLGHLPGALNIPLAALDDRLPDIPNDREIVAYCRGPFCVLSFKAVAALRTRGYRARRLEDGLPEWKEAGMTIESGPAE